MVCQAAAQQQPCLVSSNEEPPALLEPLGGKRRALSPRGGICLSGESGFKIILGPPGLQVVTGY